MIFYPQNCRKFTKLAIGMHIPTNARVFFYGKDHQASKKWPLIMFVICLTEEINQRKKIKTSILNSKRISNCSTENKKRKTGLSRSANRDCFYHLNFSPESTMKISAPSLNKYEPFSRRNFFVHIPKI